MKNKKCILEAQKEKITNFRTLWTITIYTFLGIIAYAFNFIEKLSIFKQLLIAIGIITNLIAMFYLTHKVIIETKKLKDLEC